jgi:lipopolysaccharide transport system permease protein
MKLLITSAATVFRHRHLLKEFVVREIKGRFVGSFGGLLWTVLSPLATIIAYGFVFSVVVRMEVTAAEVGTDSFLIFFLTGFFPWLMFSESLVRAAGSLLAHSALITKVVFPVELLPVSSVGASFIINGIGFFLLLVYLAVTGHAHVAWLLLPLLLVIEALFALGLAFFLAAISVFIRDTIEVLNIVVMLWFFATPIIYPLSMIPAGLQPWFRLNPMASLVGCGRDILLFHRLDPTTAFALGGLGLVSCGLGAWFFLRARPAFGDVL